jgi:RNA polymerase sigma factor (sigma-70 family)
VKYTDKDVLEAIRSGDDSVLEYLYKQVLPKVKTYVLKNNGGYEDARDIFQDAVLIFYKYVKCGKFNEEYDIAAFIFSISKNLWINLAKRKNRVVQLTEETPINKFAKSAAEELLTKEREEFVIRMFSLLGETCKQILLYSIFHKFTMKEIKEKMDFTSEDAAKTKNYKCKQRLMHIVKDNASIKDMLQE